MILRKIIYCVLLLISAIAASGILLAAFAGVINPNTFVLPALLGLAFEWLLALNALTCVMWIFTQRKRYMFISGLALLISLAPIIRTCNITSHTDKPITEKHQLKILTYNTLRLGKRHLPENNQVLKYIKNNNSDIVFLQEYEESQSNKFLRHDDIFRELSKYPYHYTQFRIENKSRKFGVAIFSKYKLFNFKNIEYESALNGAFSCDAIVDNTIIHLVCVHLESNKITGSELEQPLEDVKNKADFRGGAKVLLKKLIEAYKLRTIQAEIVAKEINSQTHKTILCGDFNDVPVSYTYHTLARNLNDAFAEAGPRGFGHTFKHKVLHVRIDYILHSKDMKAYNLHIDKNSDSDHYPVRCIIAWN